MLKGTLVKTAVAAALLLALVIIPSPTQAAEAWEELGEMPFLAEGFCTAQLPDGRVFFNGGLEDLNIVQLSSETWIYDPSSDEWEMKEPAPIATARSSAVYMPDGNVYLFCGVDQNSTWELGVMIYNIAENSWSIKHEHIDIGYVREAAAMDDERIMLAGGLTGPGPTVTDECVIYNVRTGAFIPVAPLPDPVFGGTMLKAGDSLYYIGGVDFTSPVLQNIYRYELSRGAWTQHGKLSEMRYMNEGTLGADGLVYLYGAGLPSENYPHLRALDLRDNSFRECPHPPANGSEGGIASTSDGRVIVFGGTNSMAMSQKVYSLSLYEKSSWLEPAEADAGNVVRVHVRVNATVAGGETMTATAYLIKDSITYDSCQLSSLGGSTASVLMVLPEDLPAGDYEVHVIDVDLGTGIAGTVQFEPLTLTVTEAPSPTDRIGELEDMLDGKLDAWVGYLILILVLASLMVSVIILVRKK